MFPPKKFKLFRIPSFFSIYILISFFITINNLELSPLLYPSTYTLLSQDIVLVANDSIHFFSSTMEEDTSKKITLEKGIESDDENTKTTISQFPANFGGNILILVIDIIYFFKHDGTFINSVNLTINLTDTINAKYYCLIPYKRVNNYLHYLISFPIFETISFKLIYCKFDINSPNSNYIIRDIGISPTIEDESQNQGVSLGKISGARCLFLFHSTLNKDLLVCFYSLSFPLQIQVRVFGPDNNFNELSEYFKLCQPTTQFYAAPSNFDVVTDKQKKIAHIILVDQYSYLMTYDFENDFGEPLAITDNSFRVGYIYNKFFYFSQTNEYILAGISYNLCQIYLINFYSNFTIKYEGLVDPFNNYSDCNNPNTFSMMFYENKYSIAIGNNGNSRILIGKVDEIGIIEFIENPITNYNLGNEDSQTNIQTTEITNIKTTELTNIPTTVIHTTETTIIHTTIMHTTEIIDIPTTEIHTTEITIIPTNEKTYIKESEYNPNIIILNNKCKKATQESLEYNLCIECNNEKNYFSVINPNSEYFHGFVECYNDNTKPTNFYLDRNDNKYKPCFETCSTCEIGGDEYIHNCLTCSINYIKKPETPGTTNCVPECPYSYYYTSYGQYKCSSDNNCPQDKNLYVKELKKCTDNCTKEEIYKYQYGGECIKICPEYTSLKNNICIDKDINSCVKSESEIEVKESLLTDSIDFKAKNYAKEFNYTINHVSLFYNSLYSIILYKDINCIEKLSIKAPKIDFGNCYSKVEGNLEPPTNNKIIVALIEQNNNNKKSTITYAFYHPDTGEKIDADAICKDDGILIKESVLSQLNDSIVNLDSVLFLADQDINIFDLSSPFYSDICYQFKSPNGKDIPVKERIRLFYPNISLCDVGCTYKGVNLTSMESICECKFNLLNNELMEGNALLDNTVGEITDLIGNSNLDVLKCFNNVFKLENITKSIGGYIIMGIMFFEIIFAFKLLLNDFNNIRKYLYHLTNNYINYIDKDDKNLKNETTKNIFVKRHNKVNSPPKKNTNNKNKTIKFEENYNKNSFSTKSAMRFDINNSPQKFLKRRKKISSKTILINKNNEQSINNKNLDKNYKKMEEYLKEDLDEMDYDNAIKYDKRPFCKYYIDRLKAKQMIANTFCNKDNIRPFSIRLLLLLLNIDLYFVINGLFFSEEYIIELFHLEKEDKFFDFIPRSIGRFFYATIVGIILDIIIDCIFIEENKIKRLFLREKNDVLKMKYEISEIINSIKKRYKLFIFICFFISIISWYYVSCFNNVYSGVKIEWIKSSIVIIIIMQIISCLTRLLETILRHISFKCKSERIFKLKSLLS